MRIAVDDPAWLFAFVLAPLLIVAARRSLSGLERWRSGVALVIRLAVLAAVVLALAGVRIDRLSKSVNVAYLLDQSESIPAQCREEMRRLVVDSIERRRHRDTGDRAAVIVFGREAAVEYPPVDYTPTLTRIESPIDATATDVADALRTADRILPRDAARRVVLVSDGNENLGAALRDAAAVTAGGMSIDVIAAPVDNSSDVSVDRVWAPTVTQRGRPFDLRVVLSNRTRSAAPTVGRLRIVQKAAGAETVVSESTVTLPVGKRVFTIRQQPDSADFYAYEARFVPDDPGADAYARNNLAAGYVEVRGPGRVLLIEDHEHPGEFARLVAALHSEGIEVVVQPSNATFASLADLMRYDSVLLANLPRTSGDAGSLYATLSDAQVDDLVCNTEQLGCGLVMLGGGRALGAGGWVDTPLEEAMPVDFRIKNAKVIPTGALALVIDKSGSMDGQKMALARAAANEAIRVLGPQDFVTAVAFDGEATAIAPLKRVGDGSRARRRVATLAAGGGTDLRPGMELARRELRKATDASVRHMIVLTDGQTPIQGIERLTEELRKEDQTTVTSVAVGPDADGRLLPRIATIGGGKFYSVRNPRAVPRIFVREAMRVAMPVVKHLSPPLSPLRVRGHEILSGIAAAPPPIGGFVQTTLKDSSLVDVLLRSPDPQLQANATVLATWNYGLGKTAVLTTDAGHDWANAWTAWDNYDRFFAQLVRWSMRPSGGEQEYVVTTESVGDVTRVVVDAVGDMNADAEMDLATGSATGPGGESIPFSLRQIAPGRVVGEFASSTTGAYFVSVTPRIGGPTLRTGVSVSRSAEYADVEVNTPLLTQLVNYTPPDGEEGRFIGAEPPLPFVTTEGDSAARDLDPFRRDQPPVVKSQEAWPLVLVLACVLFLGDIAWRRVRVDLPALRAGLKQRLYRTETTSTPPTLDRLRSRKESTQQQWRDRSTPGRSGPLPTDQHPNTGQLTESDEAVIQSTEGATRTAVESEKSDAASYTARLLAAKRAASRSPSDEKDSTSP